MQRTQKAAPLISGVRNIKMKRPENRLKVKQLFVFGAGASYSASSGSGKSATGMSPLDKDFCARISTLDYERPAWVKDAKDYLTSHWKDHVAFQSLGLEQALLKQLSHLEFINAIHKRKRTDGVNEATYLNHLAHIVCFILSKCRETKNEPYKKLVKHLFPTTLKADDHKNRIITFNYDVLADSHLVKRFGVERVYFDKMGSEQGECRRNKGKFNNPFLLKLHGSINWRMDTGEFNKMITPKLNTEEDSYFIKSVWHDAKDLPSPDDNISPVIMPPLPIKPITTIKLFNFLWTKAYEYLHEAEELIICGYSLPEGDRLAISLFSNFTNKNLQKVTVIDPEPSILKKWRDLINRKNVSRPLWQYYADFTEYVDAIVK